MRDPDADKVLEFFAGRSDASWGDVLGCFWGKPEWPQVGDRLSALLVRLVDDGLIERYDGWVGDRAHPRFRLTGKGRERLSYLKRPPLPGARSRPSSLSGLTA